ncbi:glycosyltransferase [Oceanimonas smirnovii]|uniref:Glycosyltransferase n=1 Tax=Oceanimonas smirnovii TaxID=264574 RepID=A0ABW7P4J6_9GAMM
MSLRRHERNQLRKGKVLLWWLWLLKQVCKSPFLKKKYNQLVAKLITRTKLFDRAWYEEVNHDLAGSNLTALYHYAAFGDNEGRYPMPLFNPEFYRKKIPGKLKNINSLLHYVYIGRYYRISPSSAFDTDHYLSNNKDVARSGIEPLYHYTKFGGIEGRSPNPNFDGERYIANNPEIRIARINPLIHYLQHGHYNTEDKFIDDSEEKINIEPLSPIKTIGNKKIDIIIPVYRDQELTIRCISSVLSATYNISCELIVINDASPEEELTNQLRELAKKSLFSLIENPENLGFVKTVNKGMQLHPERDIVLLNSDTEVYNDWLDRLHCVAKRHNDCATVTPLSNNATICSYPNFLQDNPFPLETTYSNLDKFAFNVNAGLEVEAPTGVGFCMYISRAALNQIGYFDEKAFGKGYGEENDFCQRAITKGWKNLISPEIFVRHLGGASFLGEKGKRIANALKVLAARYPDYQSQVDNFIKNDPLKTARENLDISRLGSLVKKENILMLCHARGGGAERHLQEDASKAISEGKGVFILRPAPGKPEKVVLEHPKCRKLVNIAPIALKDTKKLSETLKPLNITMINSHGMVDFEKDAPLDLIKLAIALHAPVEVDIHDYKVICPRINLADENGLYCGEPDNNTCNQCLHHRGNDFKETNITEWRDNHHKILRFAEKIWVPDDDVANRLKRYFSDLTFSIQPHDDPRGSIKLPVHPNIHGDKLHIVVVGAISKLKGFNTLLECARDAKERNLPLHYSVMGYTMNDKLMREAGVEVTGKYKESEAIEMLRSLHPDIVWLPSTWPETYSYTLSISLNAQCPIAAFNIGAIASRLRALESGEHLLPLEYAKDKVRINNYFSSLLFKEVQNQKNNHQDYYETTC